ncbi:MAG: hypothetical protein HUJ31_19135 [Pseudomonadales bacterium]|nr:hypothetical protein [Pseudomonadales bacterium]
MTEDDFNAYVKFAVEEISLEPETRVALVSPSSEKSGIMKRFANEVQSGNFRVFTQPEDAVEWINPPPA